MAIQYGNHLALRQLLSYPSIHRSFSLLNHHSHTPMQLAEFSTNSLTLQYMMNSYRVPSSPANVNLLIVHDSSKQKQNQSMNVMIRWKEVRQMNGIPAVDRYEVIVRNTAENVEMVLSDKIQSNCSIPQNEMICRYCSCYSFVYVQFHIRTNSCTQSEWLE